MDMETAFAKASMDNVTLRPDASSKAAPTLKLENGAWAFCRALRAAVMRESIIGALLSNASG
jgi:hypothetical protein